MFTGDTQKLRNKCILYRHDHYKKCSTVFGFYYKKVLTFLWSCQVCIYLEFQLEGIYPHPYLDLGTYRLKYYRQRLNRRKLITKISEKSKSIILIIWKTRHVCETQMSPIMTNSKDDQDQKDKYLETSRKILSQEILMCNLKALIFIT